MDKQKLVKNLKVLRDLEVGGAPRQSWLRDNRAGFLMRAENHGQASEQPEQIIKRKIGAYASASIIFVSPWMRKNVFRPAFVVLSAFAVVFSGWIATVNASMNSLPGDVLYPLKRATEEAQLTLSAGADKTNLQVEFASRRLEEVSKIVESADQQNKDENVATALDQFKNNINDVKANLETLKNNGQAEEAVAMAKMVDRKVGEYSSVLENTGNTGTDLSDNFKENVENAKKVVEETGVKAVEVMAEHTDTAVTMAELKIRLENKVNQLENRLQDSADKPETTSSTLQGNDRTDVAKMLVSAHKLLLANDLRGALEEVKSATSIIFGGLPHITVSSTPIVTIVRTVSASSTVTTTPRLPEDPIMAPSSTEEMNVNVQFIDGDTTSLNWLEAQINDQSFNSTDKPPEEAEDTSTIVK